MPENQPEKFCWGLTALRGGHTTKPEAAQLEERLASDSLDCFARATLLGYYSTGRKLSKQETAKRHRHIFWIIEHVPECELGKTPYLSISKTEHPQDYNKAKELLLVQCENYKTRPEVLADLGHVFVYQEPEIAERLLRKAYEISESQSSGTSQKQTADIAFWLASTLHCAGQQTKDRGKLIDAVSFMQIALGEKPVARQRDLSFKLAKMALDSGQNELATQVSKQMLSENGENNQSSHVANIVLGTIALQNADISSAVAHLTAAARVGSSPRLCSYGPMMSLAQSLLESGEREAVVQYLQDCKKFWDMGQKKLTMWIRQIEAGETPVLEGDDC